jgi:maltooligosyltrehalose trehalohydrolase
MLVWYRRVLAVRAAAIVPLIPGIAGHAGRYAVIGAHGVTVSWQIDGGALQLAANLSPFVVTGFPPAGDGEDIWREGEPGDDGSFGPWAVRWQRAMNAGCDEGGLK